MSKTSSSTDPSSTPLAQEFVQFAVACGVLKFGEFKTKAGRLSPYFFNAGLFNDGQQLGQLAEFYAQRLLAEDVSFDVLFGPAYKGIVLAAAVAIELARRGRNVPFAYNRKEAKDHGEGGTLVGAVLQGKRVMILDDVISAGTSVQESIHLIEAAQGIPCGVMIALDRQEKVAIANGKEAGQEGSFSAVQWVEDTLGIQVTSIAGLGDLLQFMAQHNTPEIQRHFAQVAAYRDRYGV